MLERAEGRERRRGRALFGGIAAGAVLLAASLATTAPAVLEASSLDGATWALLAASACLAWLAAGPQARWRGW
jgi:hypothetical protein